MCTQCDLMRGHAVLPPVIVGIMKRCGVRELRQNASALLREVADGQSIEITSNGHPIAQLIPATPDPWTALIASREIAPARREPTAILDRPPQPYSRQAQP